LKNSICNPTINMLVWGRNRYHIPILLENDVTEARNAIGDRQVKTGQRISCTGWVIKCLAQAISEYKFVHTLRWVELVIAWNQIHP
jgi:hypothetical protein